MAGIITKWYVIHTYSGYENKVKDNIEKVVENRSMQDQILAVRVPTEIVKEAKEPEFDENGEEIIAEEKTVERKIFPGYVFVKLKVEDNPKAANDETKKEQAYVMADDAWYVIRNTRGVTGFVGPESKPVPLSDAEVIAMGIESDEAAVTTDVTVDYKVGDFVTITEGKLADNSGIVKEINTETGRVIVGVSMFGRETPVELGINQVELA
ncbi:MAG: transcription termination/antitermination protein NusG [Clostridia bacterium]|nr:transcription termination/antitermination protein NusG [Clostridia bacterium]